MRTSRSVAARARARPSAASHPNPSIRGIVLSFDKETGIGAIAPLPPFPGATNPALAPSFPANARDVLSCGHRNLMPGEGVEFKVTDGRAVEILRSFEPAVRVEEEKEGAG